MNWIKRWQRPPVVAVLAVTFVVAFSGFVAPEPPVKVLVDFSTASAQNPFGGHPAAHPEGIARDGQNGFFVTGFIAGQVYRVTPGGGVTLFAELPASAGGATTGIARDSAGNLYVAHRADDQNTGVWKIGPGGGSYEDDLGANPDAPRKFFPFDPAHVGAVASPNGVTIDRHGSIFVSDSEQGRIYKIAPTSTPAAPAETLWAEGPDLLGPVTGVGVNGLEAEHAGDALYAANFDQGKVLRLSVDEPATASPIETLVSYSPFAGGLMFDGLTIDAADERLYVTGAGKVNIETSSLEAGQEIVALDLRAACLAGGPLPITTTDDPRLMSAAKDPLLNVATDVVLSPSESHLFTVDLDFLNFGQPGGAVLRVQNGVEFPGCD